VKRTARPPRWAGGPSRPSPARPGRGQATVELALTLPLITLLLMLGVDAALLVRGQLVAVQISREAARHAAVGEPWSAPLPARVDITRSGDLIRVHTVVVHRIVTPGVSVLGPVQLRAEAVMRAEGPP
jgi:hypothetical protein